MIIQASTPDPIPTPAQTPTPGRPDFRLSIHSLLDFTECPQRLYARDEAPDPRPSKHAEALRSLHLTPRTYRGTYVAKPNVYQATVKQCPACNSVGPGKFCNNCNKARHSVVVTKPWSGQAPFCAAWKQQQESRGRTILRQDQAEAAAAAAARLAADKDIAAFQAECPHPYLLHAAWHDATTGLDIPIEATVDYAPVEGAVFDDCLGFFIVTPDASPGSWSRSAFFAGYHARAALALDIWNSCHEQLRTTVLFVLSESSEPYEPGRRLISKNLLAAGRRRYQEALTRYAAALKNGEWPGYDPAGDRLEAWSVLDVEPWMAEKRSPLLSTDPAAGASAPTPAPDPELAPA